MNHIKHNNSFLKKVRLGYLALVVAIITYALWAHQQEGFVYLSGLVVVLAGFVGAFVGSTHKSEFAGWLYGIAAFLMGLLFAGAGPVLKHFGVI